MLNVLFGQVGIGVKNQAAQRDNSTWLLDHFCCTTVPVQCSSIYLKQRTQAVAAICE